jgi:hypothetical protein
VAVPGTSPPNRHHRAPRCSELPVTLQTLTAGELAFDQVVPIAAKAPAHTDTQAADLAKALTVAQLETVMNRYQFSQPEPDPGTRRADRQRGWLGRPV